MRLKGQMDRRHSRFKDYNWFQNLFADLPVDFDRRSMVHCCLWSRHISGGRFCVADQNKLTTSFRFPTPEGLGSALVKKEGGTTFEQDGARAVQAPANRSAAFPIAWTMRVV